MHLYHSIALEAKERKDVEDKINRLTSFLRSKTNKFYEFGEGMEQYFFLHYDEQAQKKEDKKNDKKNDQKAENQGDAKKKEEPSRKFVFFEEKAFIIELELALCGYFVIITSEKMTAKEALELYKGRDASEKLFLSDKTFLGNGCVRVDSDESATSKIFIEFVALIIRNRIYNYLREEKKKLDKKPNFMSVPAAIRELDKIEMARQPDGVYRIDHSVTATQKMILNAFGLTEDYVKNVAEEISLKLKTGI